ncbi:MAG TPA: SurA N-terminal domain-containing protein [Mycobacteriales bacterium]|nr:SurA N-terminal domain-containing protein [Mycobacteriales bacterium]
MKLGLRGVRRVAVAALATVAVPVLAGCDTSPDAAAVIGGSRISIATLQGEVDTALKDPQISSALAPGSQFSAALGGSKAGFVRLTLSRLISDKLISATAAAHGVTVTDKEISDQTAQFVQQAGSMSALQEQAAESVGVAPAQLPELIRLTVLQQQLSDALVATLPATPEQLEAEYKKDIDQFDTLDVSQIAVSKQRLAQRILAKVRRDPASFESLAQKYSLDTTTASNGGEVGQVPRSEIISLLGGVAHAVPGSVGIAHANGVYSVVRVNSRNLIPLSQATAQLKESLYSAQATTLLQQALAAEGRKLGVNVSPRYGKWDASSQTVVARKSAISSAG